MKDHELDSAYRELYTQISKISRIGQKITSCLNFNDIFAILEEELPHLVPTHIFALALLNENADALRWHSKIAGGEKLPPFDIPLSDQTSFGVRAFLENSEIGHPNSQNYDEIEQAAIFIPLRYRHRVTGVLSIQHDKGQIYDPMHIDSVSALASYIAIAVENTKLFEQVSLLALVDELTGVYNRRAIFDKAEEGLKRARRYKLPYSLLILDLDHFKKINDFHGHQAGDEALKVISSQIAEILRETDSVGRYGGEEFLVLLPDTPLLGAELLANRICQEIAKKPIIYKSMNIPITVSIGVSSNRHSHDLDQVIARADEALYRAKDNGRNRVMVSED